MKFNIEEFEIEEFQGQDKKEQERQRNIVEQFEDEKLREKIIEILGEGNKNFLRYVITKNSAFVGEITFSGVSGNRFEIGIELEPIFRNQGIGYKILKELMLRLSKANKIDYFIYTVRYDNLASIRLVEKLGGVRVSVIKPLEQYELAIYKYNISSPV